MLITFKSPYPVKSVSIAGSFNDPPWSQTPMSEIEPFNGTCWGFELVGYEECNDQDQEELLHDESDKYFQNKVATYKFVVDGIWKLEEDGGKKRGTFNLSNFSHILIY